MSYQVLARKWRPRSFHELIGQEHVVRPLSHALAEGRLHHALLFTGTRGVGKTTVARIFAKALNCESGVTAQPCGTCSACTAIDQGRFVDLIEIDAASRTKVEDTRELLDNVQYAPTRGRYKVYLIDEVHMLSRHSFNALLKTLEEPPPHVVFILATTDPQRLPVTVLSRCLQFNLKRLSVAAIAEHLGAILAREGIEAESTALNQLARAGDGSMRDALSLLDQAIAFGGGRVATDTVSAMLGSVDPQHVAGLLETLAECDATRLLERIDVLDQQAPDYHAVLGELLSGLQRIAVLQVVPEAPPDDALADPELLRRLAERIAPEDVQLYYQIGLLGRRDLPLAPDPRGGFEMALLRMLCFTPKPDAAQIRSPDVARSSGPPSNRGADTLAPRPPGADRRSTPQPSDATPPGQSDIETLLADWGQLIGQLSLSGLVIQLARHCVVDRYDDEKRQLTLRVGAGHAGLRTERIEQQLGEALGRRLGRPVKLRFAVGDPPVATPAQHDARRQAERRQTAAQLIEQDPVVHELQDAFQARVRPDSIRPTD